MEGVLPRPIPSTQVPTATSQPSAMSPQIKEHSPGKHMPSARVGTWFLQVWEWVQINTYCDRLYLVISGLGPSQSSPHMVLPPQIQGYPAHAQMPFAMMVPPHSASQAPPSQPQPQTSELRAALKQPSKLVQQEQLLQQERLRQQQQQQQQPPPAAHPQEHRQSPGMAQHRLPFTVQEPRQASASRAEPKHPESRPQPPHVAPFSDAHMSPGNPNPPFAHPDGRSGPVLTQVFGFQHPSMAAYAMGFQRMDPRMFQSSAAAHAALMAGMVPPGVVIPQPQVTPAVEHHGQDSRPSSARPPSRHPTPPSAQPSPRPGTPHSLTHPQTPNSVVAALPSPQDRMIAGPPPGVSSRIELREPSDGTGILLQVRI